MATVEECRTALQDLAARLAANADDVGRKVALDRRLTCRITDLGVTFRGRLTGGRLVDIADGEDPKAKIRLTASSDDLVALLQGRLDVTRAVASRQVSIKASPFDLLKLRKLL